MKEMMWDSQLNEVIKDREKGVESCIITENQEEGWS